MCVCVCVCVYARDVSMKAVCRCLAKRQYKELECYLTTGITRPLLDRKHIKNINKKEKDERKDKE